MTCTNCKQKDCPCWAAAKRSEAAATERSTVDVGAGKEALAIIDKWMESYDHMGTGTSAVARMSEREWEEDRAKLAALIAEAANAPSAGSIGKEA